MNLDAVDRHEVVHFMGMKRKPELIKTVLHAGWSETLRGRKQEGRRRNWRPARSKLGIARLCCSLVTLGFVPPDVLSISLVFCLRNLTIHSEVGLNAVHIHKYSSWILTKTFILTDFLHRWGYSLDLKWFRFKSQLAYLLPEWTETIYLDWFNLQFLYLPKIGKIYSMKIHLSLLCDRLRFGC